mmetsp:Transcript_80324/g.236292  ORF Transcript_80324/g.236292 Transcript_80324/m.236292 type:complete len:360 (+) Transcript_80324:722-1801(+)
MKATHVLKRSLASEKPTCFTARSATWRARSKSLIFRWKAMYRIQMMEVSPWLNSRRSKSSTLPGSLAQVASACSFSRCCTSLASAFRFAIFWRLLSFFLPPSSASSSSVSSASEPLAPPTLKSAHWKPSVPPRLDREAAAARSHGAASSFSSGASTSTIFRFLPLACLASSSPCSSFSAAGVSALSASSSSSSESSSFSSSSSPSKSEDLMPSQTLPFSTLVTLARGIRMPVLKESRETEGVSETWEAWMRPSTRELSMRAKMPYFWTLFTAQPTMSPTLSCSTVRRPVAASPDLSESSTRPDSEMSTTVALWMRSPGRYMASTDSLLIAWSDNLDGVIRAERFRLKETKTPCWPALRT